jgi:hypothetical protein
MSKDIKNKDLDEFEFDFDEDSKEELDDFDMDNEKVEDSKNSEDDFDFDSDEEEKVENSKDSEDDFDFDSDDEEKIENSKDSEDDFDFDSDDDEKEKVENSKDSEDDFDFDSDDDEKENDEEEKVENSKDSEDDFDFDSDDDEKENDEEEKVENSKDSEDDFDFDSDDDEDNDNDNKVKVKVEDFEFETDNDKDTKEGFDFDLEEDSEEDDDDNLKQEKAKKEKEKKKKLEEDAFDNSDNEDDLNIDDIFSANDDDDDNLDDEEYIDSFTKHEEEEEDLEDVLEDKDINSNAMKVTQNINIEEDVEVEVKKPSVNEVLQKKKKNYYGFFKKIILGFGVVSVLTMGSIGAYIYKDDLLDLFSNNSIKRQGDSIYSAEFDSKTRAISTEIFSEKIKELNSVISNYETKMAEFELNQANLMSKNKMLSNNTDEQKSIINTIQKNDNKDSKSIIEFEQKIEDFMKEVESMQSEQLNNKDLLKKTVEATLNLIKENKMLDKNLENKIYDKVYSEFKKVFDSQRFRLNDLSIIEGKLNEALSFNKKILQDLKQTKIDNQKLIEEQRDINRKVIKLEKTLEKQETSILKNTSTDNNVISLLREKKTENAIVIDKRSDNAATIPEYHLQGIIGGEVAYLKVKSQEGARARAYSVGDTLQGYGKILKIETSYIVTEKGELRRNRGK